MRRPPKKGTRWIVAHPVLGAILFGPVFATNLAVNVLLFTDLSRTAIALGFVFFALYGPFMVWMMRRNIWRWDATHSGANIVE